MEGRRGGAGRAWRDVWGLWWDRYFRTARPKGQHHLQRTVEMIGEDDRVDVRDLPAVFDIVETHIIRINRETGMVERFSMGPDIIDQEGCHIGKLSV